MKATEQFHLDCGADQLIPVPQKPFFESGSSKIESELRFEFNVACTSAHIPHSMVLTIAP